MSYDQNDLNLLKSTTKQIFMKVTLLDEYRQEVESIDGKIKTISFSSTSESDIRKTCNLSLSYNKLMATSDWKNRMVELSCGLTDNTTQEYKWYSLGKMLVLNMSTSVSVTGGECKLSLVDLMATMLAERGSQMGTRLVIPAGSSIKNALEAIVAEFSPYKLCDIVDFEDVVPYDIETNIGTYPFEAIKELLNLHPYYECFYDNEGVFVVREIPTKIEDPIDIPSDVITPMLISELSPMDLSKIKNTTEIWGRSLDAMYTALGCESFGKKYVLTIDDTFKNLEEGATYGFTPDATSRDGQLIQIQDTDELFIYTENGIGDYVQIKEGAMQAGVPYVVRYSENKFVLQGELEIHAIIQEINEMPSESEQKRFKEHNACREVQWIVNPESTLACRINGIGQISGEVRQVLQDGEYSNIYTTQLAFERARYENWLKLRVQDSIDLEMVLIPWMELYHKIEYISPLTGEQITAIVQSIDYDFKRWTMKVKCSRFYPYYPW